MSGARRWLVVALAASMVVLSACGDDDDNEAAEGGGATTTSAPAALTAWCDDVVRIQVLEPEVPEDAPPEAQEAAEQKFFDDEVLPLLDKIEREAPASAKADVTAIVTFFRDKGPAAFEDDAFAPLETRANEAWARACGAAAETAVTASDYEFRGVPPQLRVGYALFRFTNSGTELHEMILLRKKADTTESFDQLLELPEEEAKAKVDDAGGAFAFPGDTDTAVVDLKAGDYAMLCFIPVGLTPEAAMAAEKSGQGPQGPPHFTRGMKQEFKVA